MASQMQENFIVEGRISILALWIWNKLFIGFREKSQYTLLLIILAFHVHILQLVRSFDGVVVGRLFVVYCG